MKDKPEQVYLLLQSIGGIVWEADSQMQQFSFISDHVQSVLGFPPNEWLNNFGYWEQLIYPDDRHIIAVYRDTTKCKHQQVLEYRMLTANGSLVWLRDTVSLMADGRLCGVMQDITATQRLNMLEHLERSMLRLNADLSIPLKNILSAYLEGLEELFTEMHCSIVRIANGRLTDWVAPSLPAEYMNYWKGLEVGPKAGSCGTAAALKRQIIVSDITTDPLWEKYREIPLSYGLRACWSNPVINAAGQVIATLAMYYHQPSHPTQDEINAMEKATALLGIMLENREQTEVIRDTNLLMLQSHELAQFGNWRWDVINDKVTWSPSLYTIYGLDKDNFNATFAGYLERLHPDDHDQVYGIIKQVLTSGADAEFDERVYRPDGSLRYLRSWAKLKKDGNGNPVEMIGACLDNTEKVLYANAVAQQSRQLLDIAWLQSHAVRSPLARIMALSDLLRNTHQDDAEHKNMLDYLYASAIELDEQVKLISSKAEIDDDSK